MGNIWENMGTIWKIATYLWENMGTIWKLATYLWENMVTIWKIATYLWENVGTSPEKVGTYGKTPGKSKEYSGQSDMGGKNLETPRNES